MPAIVVDGVSIAYDDVAAGECAGGAPLLFLHEMTATKDEWVHQVSHFSASRRVIVPNAVGYPPSDVPEDPAAYTIERQVAHAIGLLQHLGVSRAHVIGHSMGAHTALELALRHPERAVSIAILGGGSGQTNREGFQKQCLQMADNIEQGGVGALADYNKGVNRRRFEMRDPIAYKKYFDAVAAKHSPLGRANTLRGFQAQRPSWYDQEAELRSLRVPTLVVNGDEDEPCLGPGLFLKRTLPNCGLAILPQVGHTLQVEEAEGLNRLLARFFEEVENSSSYPGRCVPLDGFTRDAFSNSMSAGSPESANAVPPAKRKCL